jgi:DNA-binding NtrC family response regulator
MTKWELENCSMEILSDEGHVVYSAENAQQARTVRDQLLPDLVLLDIWMPDTDGVTLLKEWAKDDKLTMPVIMMSGHATISILLLRQLVLALVIF